jgi:hypothetical protein
VPSVGSVRSWDNILKHLRTRPDALTVWHARNEREAVQVDRYRAAQITPVGAPQLDVYFRRPRSGPHAFEVPRTNGTGSGGPAQSHPPPHDSDPTGAIADLADADTFSHRRARAAVNPSPPFADLPLDPRKKTILLATSSFTYDSDQTYLVDVLLDAIRTGQIRHAAQIVLRLHPDDRVGRYLKYRHAPEVILDIPDRYLATLGWTMTIDDLERMAALLRAADVMVNFATTVTLEAAIVDTPTLLVAFSPIDPDEMQRYVVDLHFKMHYKDLVERDLVPIAWNREDLIGWINRYLDDPGLYREQRASIVREWVEFTDGRSGQRLGDAILRHAGLEPPPTLSPATSERLCAPH